MSLQEAFHVPEPETQDGDGCPEKPGRRSATAAEKWVSRFLDYTAGFGHKDPRYELKRIHTLGVLGYMNALLQLEQIADEDRQLADCARIAAVFHDIGRFEQLRQYGTFFDGKSTDHAALSVQVLRQTGLLDELDPVWRTRVLDAIAQHNRLTVSLQDPKARLICNLVRDADRLDILRVFAVDDIQDMTSFSAEQAVASPATEAVARSILEGRCVNKQDRKAPMDIWLTYLGFVNDFQFLSSYRLCKAAGFWRQRFDSVNCQDPAVLACLEHAEALLNEKCRRTETDSETDRGTSLSGV